MFIYLICANRNKEKYYTLEKNKLMSLNLMQCLYVNSTVIRKQKKIKPNFQVKSFFNIDLAGQYLLLKMKCFRSKGYVV